MPKKIDFLRKTDKIEKRLLFARHVRTGSESEDKTVRIIAGSIKGRNLVTRDGQDTRPTADRYKEQLFDTLGYRVAESVFLDLFSGSGSIALEALSRGAEHAVLVEKAPDAVACIRENLKNCRMESKAELLYEDVPAALNRLQNEVLAGKRPAFDIIFMDPPYRNGWEDRLLTLLNGSPLLAEDGWFVIESAGDTVFSEEALSGWEIIKEKGKKTTKFTFLRRDNTEEEA